LSTRHGRIWFFPSQNAEGQVDGAIQQVVEDITRGEWAECLAIVGGLLLLGNSRYDVYEFKDRNKESDLAGLEPICRELRIAWVEARRALEDSS